MLYLVLKIALHCSYWWGTVHQQKNINLLYLEILNFLDYYYFIQNKKLFTKFEIFKAI